MITSTDIAKKSGVSRATVSRYFNNPETVAKKSRNKVANAIKELNYVPNMHASSLKREHSKTIGIIIPDIVNPFYIDVAYRLQNRLKKENYNLIIQFSNESMTEELQCIDFMMANRVECLLFSPMAENETVLDNKGFYSKYLLQIFRNSYKDFSSVYIDDVQGGYIAAEELIKNGHKKILLIENIADDQGVVSSRKKGYESAFLKYGLKPIDDFYLAFKPFEDSPKIIEESLLKTGATAAIVVAYNLQRQFINVLQRLNIKIFDDISLVFYDATPYSEQYEIATVTHHFDEMTDKIIDAIFRRIKNNGDASAVAEQVVPYLKEGKSIKPL